MASGLFDGDWLFDLRANDTLVIAYVGHAEQDGSWPIADVEGTEARHPEALLCQFVRTIHVRQLSDAEMLIVSDSCFSGKLNHTLHLLGLLGQRRLGEVLREACSGVPGEHATATESARDHDDFGVA